MFRGGKAVGIIRVSRVAGREGERFVSPGEQRGRIVEACEREGLELIAMHEELDVSGGKALAERPGLRAAVEAVECGSANVVAAAYFDRLFRSLSTQAEVVERVERAGGHVLAVDVGRVTADSAGQWLSGTMMGAVAEYVRRTAKERSAAGQAKAVQRGATPWPRVPLGYERQEDGTLRPSVTDAPIVRRAFEMRDKGASIAEIRKMLEQNGVGRSHKGIGVMLQSRTYLGELHFGKLVNPSAHEAIIEPALWERVQRRRVPRGPKPKSERLLARLGVLRCGSCGARLSVTAKGGADYQVYRCTSINGCPHRVAISAELVEGEIIAWVKGTFRDVTGTGSAASHVSEARAQLEAAQSRLEAAVRSLADAGLASEPASIETLEKLREARDQAKQTYEEAVEADESLTVALTLGDWDDLNHAERRQLIQATIKRALVHPGRGAERIEIEAR